MRDAVVEQTQRENVLNLANHVAILDTAIVGDADIAGRPLPNQVYEA